MYQVNKKRRSFNTNIMQKMMFEEQELELDDYQFQYKIDSVQAEIDHIMPYFSGSHQSNQHSSLNKDGVSE